MNNCGTVLNNLVKIFHPKQSSPRLDKIKRNQTLDSGRNLNNLNMENSNSNVDNLDNIYKGLRLLPEFDGNCHVLTRFIKLCDELVKTYMSTIPGQELGNLALLNGILNKVTGPAARLINSNGIPDSWDCIRSSLINNFADHRDETSLYNDLALLTQGSGTPQEFYDKCQNLFSTIMTYISLHEDVATTIASKRSLYKKLTLQSFVRGLKDPLGCRIRCMRPSTIEQALEFVQEELNTMYLQQRNDKSSFNQVQSYKVPFAHHANALAMPSPRYSLPSTSRPLTPHYPHNPLWRPRYGGPSRTQQIFSAPPPNYRPNNAFRLPQQNYVQNSSTNNKVLPMSGVSHYISKPLPATLRGHDWSKQGNPPPTNYFKSREINFNEFYGEPLSGPYDNTEPFDYYGYSDYNYPCNVGGEYYNSFCNEVPEYGEVEVEEQQEDSNSASSDHKNFQKDPKSNALG